MNSGLPIAHLLAPWLLAIAALAQPPAPAVNLGIDELAAQDFAPLRDKRVGLITNPTGVARDLRPTVDVLYKAPRVKLTALFGPEHGVRGDVPAGDSVQDSRDEVTGLRVFSLYGKTRKPTPEMLAGLDVLVFDMQDIGARSYTYISTLAVAMEAAAEQGLEFVVLDRPNPLGGQRVEGRPLEPRFKSFVGQLQIPYLHGMTIGELAQMIDGEGWLAEGRRCRLRVIPMRGWRRDMLFRETGLTWIPTSPHVPRVDSAAFYATTGIMGELQVLSEGVGYTLPFEVAGAPWINAQRLAEDLNGRRLPGVYFRPLHFQPFYARFAREPCGGVQLLLLDERAAELTPIQFHIMDAVRHQHPDKKLFGNKRDDMFDKVCGTDQVRKLFIEGRPIEEILSAWRTGADAFRVRRAKYLLYP